MKRLRLLFPLVLLFAASRASALGMYFEGGLHFGGDDLVKVTYTDGSSDSIQAGRLLSLAIGVTEQISYNVQGRVSLGYKYDFIKADNGTVSFSRMPLDILAMYYKHQWMFGGGLTFHLSPEVEVDVTPSVTGPPAYDTAYGLVLAFDYNTYGYYQRDWYLGGRVTLINYKNPTGSFSGNSVGVVFGYMF